MHFQIHLVEDLGRLGSFFYRDSRPFENFKMHIRQPYRMMFLLLCTLLPNTVQKMSTNLQNVPEAGDGEETTQCGQVVLEETNRL